MENQDKPCSNRISSLDLIVFLYLHLIIEISTPLSFIVHYLSQLLKRKNQEKIFNENASITYPFLCLAVDRKIIQKLSSEPLFNNLLFSSYQQVSDSIVLWGEHVNLLFPISSQHIMKIDNILTFYCDLW